LRDGAKRFSVGSHFGELSPKEKKVHLKSYLWNSTAVRSSLAMDGYTTIHARKARIGQLVKDALSCNQVKFHEEVYTWDVQLKKSTLPRLKPPQPLSTKNRFWVLEEEPDDMYPVTISYAVDGPNNWDWVTVEANQRHEGVSPSLRDFFVRNPHKFVHRVTGRSNKPSVLLTNQWQLNTPRVRQVYLSAKKHHPKRYKVYQRLAEVAKPLLPFGDRDPIRLMLIARLEKCLGIHKLRRRSWWSTCRHVFRDKNGHRFGAPVANRNIYIEEDSIIEENLPTYPPDPEPDPGDEKWFLVWHDKHWKPFNEDE